MYALLNLTQDFVFVRNNEKPILYEGILTDVIFTFKRMFCEYFLNDKNTHVNDFSFSRKKEYLHVS